MTETGYKPFQAALPVWIAGRETEKNLTARFSVQLAPCSAQIRLTASTLYRMFVNGRLFAYGPARGPRNFFRVDELELTDALTQPENTVVIEVAGYNINSYYTVEAPSFLQAEIVSDGRVLAHTAPDGEFLCSVVHERIQKVQRYSFQRPFAEAWTLSPAYTALLTALPEKTEPLAVQEEKVLLPRRVPFATLATLPCEAVIAAGSIAISEQPTHLFRDRSLVNIGETLHGYREDELEVHLTGDADHYAFTRDDFTPRAPLTVETLPAGRFITAKFHNNHSGFPAMHVVCREKTRLVALMDEIVLDNDINFWRMGDVCNIIRWDLEPGEYDLLAFECYTLQGMKLAVLEGCAALSDIHLVEYASSAPMQSYTGDNANLQKIWNAAIETYRQNAVDVFTDCPSRERAGWLCDSYWTARVEKVLTGESVVERNFLENFLLPESHPYLPKGMFPMCYPADHNDGVYIPNWAMWLVLELREYLDRSGDRAMIDAFKSKLDDFFAFMDSFLNEDGLLEHLPSWVFVEWSRANALVQDVNYPSNMLYAQCKQAYGELYGDQRMLDTADAMRKTIVEQSFGGDFFIDNAVRGEDGKLHLSGEKTEVCQYYAFYFGAATPEKYPELWEKLLHDFGPHRKEHNKYPEVHFANAFIGNYLRLDLLDRYGYSELVKENIEGYFTKMAELTGTLWEHDNTCASLDHGFASHVVCWLMH